MHPHEKKNCTAEEIHLQLHSEIQSELEYCLEVTSYDGVIKLE